MANAFSRLMSRSLPDTSIAAQLIKHDAAIKAISEGADASQYPVFYVERKPYLFEEWLVDANKRGKQRSSWITEHFYLLAPINEVTKKRDGPPKRLCKIDDKQGRVQWYSSDATDSASSHLNKNHGIYKPGSPEEQQASARAASRKRTQPGSETASLITDKQIQFAREIISRWIIESNVPFRCVQHDTFRLMMEFFNRELTEAAIPHSHTTISKYIIGLYEKYKTKLKEDLASAGSRVHISFDLWTSPNHLSLMAVVGHYLDKQLQSQTRLLSLKRLEGDHGGKNQARLILQVLQDYSLDKNKLGCLVGDNASSNNTAARTILQEIYSPADEVELEELCTIFRIRCFGHLLNLAAQIFINGENPRKKDDEDNDEDDELPAAVLQVLNFTEAERKEWNQKGPYGKLHNNCFYINRSDQRRQAWVKICGKEDGAQAEGAALMDDAVVTRPVLYLLKDNKTRWNSVYKMIIRALQFRSQLDSYAQKYSTTGEKSERLHKDDVLTPADWAVLEQMRDILQPFYMLTKYFEGHHARFHLVAPFMHWLIAYLKGLQLKYDFNHDGTVKDGTGPGHHDRDSDDSEEEGNDDDAPRHIPSGRAQRKRQLPKKFANSVLSEPLSQYAQPTSIPAKIKDLVIEGIIVKKSNAFLYHRLDLAIAKLQKYADIMDRSPTYWGATFCHPSHKFKWLQENMPHEMRDIQASIKKFHDDCYQSPEPEEGPSSPEATPVEVFQADWMEEEVFPDGYFEAPPHRDNRRDYNTYLEKAPIPVKNPMSWWANQESEYPAMYTMAMDLLSIPAMSAECERVFSAAKLTVTDRRSRLHERTIHAIECVKNWMKNGLCRLGLSGRSFGGESLMAAGEPS